MACLLFLSRTTTGPLPENTHTHTHARTHARTHTHTRMAFYTINTILNSDMCSEEEATEQIKNIKTLKQTNKETNKQTNKITGDLARLWGRSVNIQILYTPIFIVTEYCKTNPNWRKQLHSSDFTHACEKVVRDRNRQIAHFFIHKLSCLRSLSNNYGITLKTR